MTNSHEKKARIWTSFLLDRKQYGWFALFRLAKMLPSVSCCWFQSTFLLAQWTVNTHASLLWNFCRLSFLALEECLNRNFIHWNMFHPFVYKKVAVKNSPIIWMQFHTGYKFIRKRQTDSLFKSSIHEDRDYKNTARVHTSNIRVHTGNIRVTYEYIRATGVTYEYIRVN